MPSSQLKTLRQSLREQGFVGQQRSKKRKRQTPDVTLRAAKVQRSHALQQIRDQLNPFDVRPNASAKFESFANDVPHGEQRVNHPGLAKARGEANVSSAVAIQLTCS